MNSPLDFCTSKDNFTKQKGDFLTIFNDPTLIKKL